MVSGAVLRRQLVEKHALVDELEPANPKVELDLVVFGGSLLDGCDDLLEDVDHRCLGCLRCLCDCLEVQTRWLRADAVVLPFILPEHWQVERRGRLVA